MVALKPASMLSLKIPSLTAQTTTQCVSGVFFRPQKGARYLNPQTGLWLSTDPAMGEYVPQAPTNDDAKKANQNLPGMGGVFNVVNLHVYHYAGNNPVKYTDPDGNDFDDLIQKATDYLKLKTEEYIESLKQEASVSGRATVQISFATTINGIKVKGSFTGVAEVNSRNGFTMTLEAGLDFGLGTPGQEIAATGADLTFGLRVSFGVLKNNGIRREGVRSISLAVNGGIEVAGKGVKFEYRKEIVNFDTPTGNPAFTLFTANTNKFGIGSDQRYGVVNVGVRGRVNGF